MTDTAMDRYFDAWTLRHLDAWLYDHVHGETVRAAVRARMLTLAADDPEYWSGQGWPNLYDRADCERIRQQAEAVDLLGPCETDPRD